MTMTADQIDSQLGRLVHNYRVGIDDEAAAELHKAITDAHVAPQVLEKAITRTIRTRKFLPNVAELLEDIEAVRGPVPVAERAPYEPCDDCNDGWVEVVDTKAPPIFKLVMVDGAFQKVQQPPAKRLARCACFVAYFGPMRPLPSPKPDTGLTAASAIASTSAKVRRFQMRVANSKR